MTPAPAHRTADGARMRVVQAALEELTSGTGDLQAALEYVAGLEGRASFYAALHAVLGQITGARNLTVLLRVDGSVRCVYHVDEHEPASPRLSGSPPGLAEYVMRTERALFAASDVIRRLVARGEVAAPAAPLSGCLGAPVFVGGDAAGALVVTCYEPGEGFRPEDLEPVLVVARFVGQVVTRLHAADSPQESEARFRSLAETAPCAIVILDRDEMPYANSAARALLDAVPGDGATFWSVVHPDDVEMVQNRAAARLAGRPAPTRFDFRIVRPDGQERWLDFSLGTIRHRGRTALLGVGVDATEQKQAQQQMYALAYLDPLTGLPNRMLLRDRLGVALADAARRGTQLALLFIDLDDFKNVNDSLGHGAGDELLREVGSRICGALREGDTVARIGGDEFVVMVTGLAGGDEAAAVAAKILHAVRTSVRIGERDLAIHASMGVALYPEDGTDVETLLKHSDAAMYRAKEHGRDNYQLYTRALHDAALDRIALECDLRRAIADGELELHYQPIYDVRARRFHGFEALVRWPHPERGLLQPGDFLPAAEKARLMDPLGRWVLREACTQAQRWRGRWPLTIAVNVEPRQFEESEFLAHVKDVLETTGLDPACLDLEMTETEAMRDPRAVVRVLGALRGLGVRVSIDDFGTGYSSLSCLTNLPIHTLKIDRSFVHEIAARPSDAAIASAIIALGHNLGLAVLAEGVETEEQLALLKAAGCDRIQGFLYSPPLTAEEAGAFLERTAGR